MKHFPRCKLKFDAEAKCLTNVPDEWSVLLSQRRRWINSTVHNLIELLVLIYIYFLKSVNQLCGFCCFSMRFIVFIDLFSTVVQPTGILYIAYLVYSLLTDNEVFPLVSLVILASICKRNDY